jgi:hypothetical protein
MKDLAHGDSPGMGVTIRKSVLSLESAATTTMASGRFEMDDPEASQFAQRFYRVHIGE